MNRTEVKLFKRMSQFSKWTLLVGEKMQKPFDWMSQPFKQFVECFEWIILGIWTDNEWFTPSNG